MARFFVAVADSVFPNLDPAKAVLSEIGAELELAADSSPASVMKLAADADLAWRIGSAYFTVVSLSCVFVSKSLAS